MSVHRSLVSKSKLRRERNVLSRAERLLILKKDGRWDEEKSVYGLPKVKARIKTRKAKGKKGKPEETATEEEAAEATDEKEKSKEG